MDAFRTLTSPAVFLPVDDVDTDQIIPSRFLKGTTRKGLGRALFADWRYGSDGAPRPDFALNRPQANGARVLVTGANFGCGSSREHAVWALQEYGFRVVVARSFADIFRGNALKNGLLPVVLGAEPHARLLASPERPITIDLESREVCHNDVRATFDVPAFARHCLLHGIDELDFLLRLEPAIARFETSIASDPSRFSGVIDTEGIR